MIKQRNARQDVRQALTPHMLPVSAVLTGVLGIMFAGRSP
jgi:hypothetical protein